MNQRARRAATGIALAAATLALSACTSEPLRLARSAPAKATAPRQPPPESLWHLRAGLNVAALSCRGAGRESVAGGYARMLRRHKEILAAAYRAEEKRYGVPGNDKHQTRLYNRYALQRRPEQFCHNSATVARQANAMDSTQLATNSAKLVKAF